MWLCSARLRASRPLGQQRARRRHLACIRSRSGGRLRDQSARRWTLRLLCTVSFDRCSPRVLGAKAGSQPRYDLHEDQSVRPTVASAGHRRSNVVAVQPTRCPLPSPLAPPVDRPPLEGADEPHCDCRRCRTTRWQAHCEEGGDENASFGSPGITTEAADMQHGMTKFVARRSAISRTVRSGATTRVPSRRCAVNGMMATICPTTDIEGSRN